MIGGEQRQRARELSQELLSNPFVPILFAGESIKVTGVNLVMEAAGRNGPTEVKNAAVLLLAVISVICWLYTYDDVAWGLSKAADEVEDQLEDDK